MPGVNLRSVILSRAKDPSRWRDFVLFLGSFARLRMTVARVFPFSRRLAPARPETIFKTSRFQGYKVSRFPGSEICQQKLGKHGSFAHFVRSGRRPNLGRRFTC